MSVLFGVAFLLRMAWLLFNQPVPISDFGDYHKLGLDLVEHGQLGYPDATLKRLPGFPFFLACVLGISRSVLWAGTMTALLSSALVPIVYVFALQLSRQSSMALLAALLCALYPTFVFSASLLASEHLATLLTMTSLVLAVRFWRTPVAGPSSHVYVVVAGLLLGAAVLTRGEAIFYLPVLTLFVAVRPRARLWRGALAGVLLFAGAACVVVPWYQRNMRIDERAGLSTTSGLNFYLAHNAKSYGWSSDSRKVFRGLDAVERDQKAWRLGWQHVRDSGLSGVLRSTALGTARLWLEPPIYAVKWSTVTKDDKRQMKWNSRLGYRAPGYVLTSLCYYALLALACLAWRHRATLNKPEFYVALGFTVMNWICYAFVFWGKARYRYLVEVLLCVFAAIALHEILRNWRGANARDRPV